MINKERLIRLLQTPRGNPRYARATIINFLSEVADLDYMEVANGNFMATQGSNPTTIFCAHYDTVDPHDLVGGTKALAWFNRGKTLLGLSTKDTSGATCLGADDGAGCEILAQLWEAGVPGVYVWSAEEETGCQGTRRLLNEMDITKGIERVISFDRIGTTDIITKQVFQQTCSDKFALALACSIGMGHVPSDHGVFTDSKEYSLLVPECTNIAVGYANAHSRNETLDLSYLSTLVDHLIPVDWDLLPVDRDIMQQEVMEMIWDYPALVYQFVKDKGLLKELQEYIPNEETEASEEAEEETEDNGTGRYPTLCYTPEGDFRDDL